MKKERDYDIMAVTYTEPATFQILRSQSSHNHLSKTNHSVDAAIISHLKSYPLSLVQRTHYLPKDLLVLTKN